MSYRMEAWNALPTQSLVKILFALSILLMLAAASKAYSSCGNGICDPYEDQYSCPQDCGYYGYGGGYGGGYGYPTCQVIAPSYGYTNELVPVSVYYNGYGMPADTLVDCGNGQVRTAYFYGSNYAYTTCNYRYGGAMTIYANSGGAYCYPATLYIDDGSYGNYPAPSPSTPAYPSPSPKVVGTPSCALTSSPAKVKAGWYSQITANYYNLPSAPNTITIDCGNGLTVNAVGCSGTTGSCYASCYYPDLGTFSAAASASGTSCAPSGVEVVTNPAAISCSANSECGSDGYVSMNYCSGGNVVRDYRTYTCTNPGKSTSACQVGNAPAQQQQCQYGCTNGACNAQPAAAACAVTTSPDVVEQGESSVATINYYNLNAAPNTISVDCGNGASKNAVSCNGKTGSCSTTCTYSNAGTFKVKASTPDAACAQDSVQVLGTGGSGTGTGGNTYYADTVFDNILLVGDSVVFNSGYRVQLQNVAKPAGAMFAQATLAVFNPAGMQVATVSSDFGQGTRTVPSANDMKITVVFAVLASGGMPAKADVRIESAAAAATPGPTPSCALTAMPQAVQAGSTSNILVSYYNLNSVPNTVAIDCGNGQQANALNCIGTTGSCSAQCFYQNTGSFPANALASGTACSPVKVSVTAMTQPTCSDGTPYNTCSNDKPKYCDSGFLVNDPATCGCPIGKELQGNQCVASQGSCSVAVNPYPVKAGSPESVLVSYTNFPQKPSQVQVLCGDGRTTAASCTATSQTDGTCSASCAYDEQTNYPALFTVDATAQGTRCASAQAKVVAPSATTGTLLVKATDCDSGAALEGATVSVPGLDNAFTDAFGQVTTEVAPGTYAITVSKKDFDNGFVTKQVKAGATATASICLNAKQCVLNATLVSAPQQGDSHLPLLYGIRLDNNGNADLSVAASYSSPFNIQGPVALSVPAKGSRMVSLQAFPPVDSTGDSAGIATFTTSTCSQSVQLPIHVEGGLSLEVSAPQKDATQGMRQCFDFQLRNRGGNAGVVSLTYSGPSDASFNVQQFQIQPYEIRDGLQFCVNVPQGASGAQTFNLHASSPISDAFAIVTLNAPSAGDYSIDTPGCFYPNNNVPMQINIANNAQDGDYGLELQNNRVGASVEPPFLYNFQKGSSRTVYLYANPDSVTYEEHPTLLLKLQGRTVASKDLCIRSPNYNGYPYNYNYNGNYYNPNNPLYDATLSLLQGSLQLAPGQTGSVTAQVQNTGRVSDDYQIEVGSLSGKASPSTLTLRPGENQQSILTVTAAGAGTYTVPVRLYSMRRGQSTGYYNGNYNGNYFNGGQVNCGNSRTETMNCPEGSGSCSTSCDYDVTGTNTLSANVGDTTCEDTKVRVIDSRTPACQVGVESFVRPGSTAEVTIRYNNLDSEALQGHMQVDCGNGLTVNASGCYGTTGSCTSTCYYSNRGVYFVGASSTSSGCGIARINVDDNGNFCSMNVQPLVVSGHSASVELTYRGIGYSGSNTYNPYAYNYNYYSANAQRTLVATQNLQVTVGSGGYVPGPTGTALTLDRVTVQDLSENGMSTISASVTNPSASTVPNVLLNIDGLPSGITAQNADPVTLGPGETRTLRLQLKASGASVGGYSPTARVTSPQGTLTKAFSIQVYAESQVLNADVKTEGDIECAPDGDQNAVLQHFTVTNHETADIGISGLLSNLPADWNFQIRPLYQIINPGQSFEFNVTVNTTGYSPKDLPLVFQVRHRDGRRASLPFDLALSKCGGAPFGGLFVLSTNFSLLQVLAVLAVLAIAMLIYFSARPGPDEGDEQPPGGQPPADEAEKARMRQLTLDSIKDEVRKPAAATSWGESTLSQESAEETVDETAKSGPAA